MLRFSVLSLAFILGFIIWGDSSNWHGHVDPGDHAVYVRGYCYRTSSGSYLRCDLRLRYNNSSPGRCGCYCIILILIGRFRHVQNFLHRRWSCGLTYEYEEYQLYYSSNDSSRSHFCLYSLWGLWYDVDITSRLTQTPKKSKTKDCSEFLYYTAVVVFLLRRFLISQHDCGSHVMLFSPGDACNINIQSIVLFTFSFI